MSLLDTPKVRTLKPFQYPWAYEYWLTQQKIHWLPEEVPFADDVRDYSTKLTDNERELITQIFRWFTQADVEVNDNYHSRYLKIFKPTEIQMMLIAFADQEAIHAISYSHLLDTLGLPETEYSMFMQYKEMTDKYDYMQSFSMDSKHEIAKTLAGFGAFTEGVQLFASFAILMNFPRFGKLKGMGQIISWSVRDESLHVEGVLKLLNTFIDENPEIWTAKLRDDIYDIAKTMISHEDKFIELAFSAGPIEGLTSKEVQKYIRYIADRRLLQMKMKPYFGVTKNPLPWMDSMINSVEHTNFFEQQATEYSKASSQGSWNDAF